MAEFPVLQWWPRDFIVDTRGLSLEQRGAYRELLDFMWLQASCSLPDDDAHLARLLSITELRWTSRIRPAIAPFFVIKDGVWTNRRLAKERAKCIEKVEKNRESGSLGGRAKARNLRETRLANASETLQRKPSQPEPEPDSDSESRTDSSLKHESQNQTPKPEPSCSADAERRVAKPGLDRGFEVWWQCWDIPGTKRSKAKARAEYAKARRAGTGHADLCRAVAEYMTWCRIRGDPPDKIKHPTTWLRGGCWEDELPEPIPPYRRRQDDGGWGEAIRTVLGSTRAENGVDQPPDDELADDDDFRQGPQVVRLSRRS